MTEPRNPRNRRRRPKRSQKPADLWRAVPHPPEPQPIAPAADPTAVLRSLGDPPLQGRAVVAERYMAAVTERAAALATALAAAGGLLAADGEDPDGGE